MLLALAALQLLVWTGGSAIVPLLPTYLRAHGSSPALVGVVMASYFAAAVVTQYPLGRQADRVGPRVVVAGGLAIFAVGAVGFAFITGAAGAISFRSLQGIGAGAVTVASAAAIATALEPAGRGRGFALLNASQMLGLAIGPLVGGLLGSSSMRLLFLVSAVMAAAALVPLNAALPARRTRSATSHARAARLRLSSPALLGAACIFVTIGLLTGLYEACWSLLLQSHRASSLAIGLSWTLYCLPYAALSGLSGRLADRVDRRVLAVVGTLSSSVFAVIYPLLRSVPVLVGLGCCEAVGAVLVTPAALSMLSQWTPASAHGAAQGAIGTARTAATAVAAACCGALFGLVHALPFDAVAVAMFLLAAATAWTWRRLPGRVDAAAPDLPLIVPDTPAL
jgi:DHA1 family multidrug resistance protein-like MFS transporter